MISLRNRGKYSRAVREEFEHFAARLSVFLGQIFDADGNYIDRNGNVLLGQDGGLAAVGITKIRHEDVAFGSTETSKTVDVRTFDGFADAQEDEVAFTFHGPWTVMDSAGRLWELAMNPTTFPTLTFTKTSITSAGNSANLPVSTHYWSMWRRRSS